MKRSEQKINDTWNMEDMFASDKVWEEDFEKATKEVAKYKEFSGKIKDSKDKLIEFLKFNDEISLLAERLYVYANQNIMKTWVMESIRHIQEKHRNLL